MDTPFVFLRPDTEDIGLVILASKKVFRTAVERNRAKRRIRAAYAFCIKAQKTSTRGTVKNSAYRVLAKKPVLKAPFEELKKLMQQKVV